jgi:hypothetical protein
LAPNKWNWILILQATLLGLPLGTIFALSGSLLVPTILHLLVLVSIKLGKV